MLFGSFAMIQGLIIGLGDLFLGVQTVNWFLFLLTLMISSLIFVLIIYSLTVTLGKVGQALSILLCHMILPLIIGLVIGKYTETIKEKLEKELHKTDVIG